MVYIEAIKANCPKCNNIFRGNEKRVPVLREIALQKSKIYITFFDSIWISRKGLHLAREHETEKKGRKPRKKGLLREYLEAAAIAILIFSLSKTIN